MNPLDQADVLIFKRNTVLEATKELFIEHPSGTFTGRGNTKQDVQDRLRLYKEMLQRVAQGQ